MYDATPPPARGDAPAAARTGRSILFVGGCPRSGTTALTTLLNHHRDVLIGNERYYRVIERGELTPGHFEPSRFLDVRGTDVHEEPLPRWPGASPDKLTSARVIGDKYPPVFRRYGLIAERFAGAHVVYILRNPFSVAESYEARARNEADAWHFRAARGVDDWNESLAATLDALAAGLPITVVGYETVLRDRGVVDRLAARIGLDPEGFAPGADALIAEAARLAERAVPRREDVRRMVAMRADFARYRDLSAHALASG